MPIVTKYTDVPGWSDFFYIHNRIIEFLPDNANILEVGVGFGRSTWTLLDCMKTNMQLSVLDSFAHHDSFSFWQHSLETNCVNTLDEENTKQLKVLSQQFSQQELFLHFIKQHPSYSKLETVYSMTSKEYMNKKYNSNYDLVFLDGDHSYNMVKQELNFFKNCRVIAGHDYMNCVTPGVTEAVDEFLIQNPDRKFAYDEENSVFLIHRSDDHFEFEYNN
jgi:hypothetical protein